MKPVPVLKRDPDLDLDGEINADLDSNLVRFAFFYPIRLPLVCLNTGILLLLLHIPVVYKSWGYWYRYTHFNEPLYSEKDSTLAIKHRQLWQAFLGRFNDISVAIRTKCVQYTMHFLTNHPELLDDITETLKLRQHDSEESVRYEVVIAIVSTAKKDFDVVSQSEDLLNFVKVSGNGTGTGFVFLGKDLFKFSLLGTVCSVFLG